MGGGGERWDCDGEKGGKGGRDGDAEYEIHHSLLHLEGMPLGELNVPICSLFSPACRVKQ